MKKFFYIVRLKSFFTETSGDVVGKGEFSIVVSNDENEFHYPSEGYIKLGNNETFSPRPYPTIFTGTIESGQTETLHINVTEHDIREHDIFVDSNFSIHTDFLEQDVVLEGTEHHCALQLNILLEEVEITI